MNLKIYFEQEIYRIPEVPSSLESLNQLISSKFSQSLPASWKLYSSDNDGNQTLISNNIDYLNLLQSNQQGSPQTLRIHVQPAPAVVNVDNENNQGQVQEEIKSNSAPRVMEMDFGSGSTSVYSFNDEIFDKKGYKKAKQLIKKLGKIRHAEKRAFLFEKLQRIEHFLSPEQKEELQKKKEKYEINKIMTQDLPHHRHMMRHHHHGDEEMYHFRHRHGHGHGHGYGHGHHHHRGHHHHGRRHHYHRGHSRSRSSSSSSSSSRSSSHEKHGKKFHKRQFKHDKFYEKLQKVMLISKGPNGEGQGQQQADALEAKFDQICINSQQGQNTQQHHVKCNGCGVENIVGVRYKCSECLDFNFCEVCEAIEEHPHVFLKMKTPMTNASVNVSGIFHAAHLYKRKQKERPHRVFKAFKTFHKMTKAMKKGDMKKFNKCHDKFFGKFSEEAKRLFSGACEWRPEMKQQIEEEWFRLKQKNFERKSIQLDPIQDRHDNIERYVDEQLSKLTISD